MLGVRGRDGCIAGRNFDLGFSGSDIRLIRCTPDSGIGSTGCGGWLGRYDGMNKAGLVAAMAVVEPPSRQQPEECSLPPSLVIRTLLDNARTTADAITVISDMGYWASVNYLLADAAGDVAIVESAPSRTSIRSSAGTVVATNHFQLAATARRDSLNRYDLALSEAGQHLTCALQMKQLLDQLGHPRLTRWQIVFMPSKKTLLFSGGYRASLLLMRV